jgi:hypothetical protein
MSAKFFTLATFALAAVASPVIVVRDDTPAPKPAKGAGGFGGFSFGGKGSSGSSGSTAAPSSSGGLSSFAGLDGNVPNMSSQPLHTFAYQLT